MIFFAERVAKRGSWGKGKSAGREKRTKMWHGGGVAGKLLDKGGRGRENAGRAGDGLRRKKGNKMKKLLGVAVVAAMAAAGAWADVTLEQAKQIALEKAGVAADGAVFAKAHRDFDDGRAVYDLEFWAGGREYELDVDAATGDVTEFEVEEHRRARSEGAAVSLEEAKGIALARVGLKADEVRFKKAYLDRDDGRKAYDIEFAANGLEYEFDIDAATGAILDFDTDRED